MRRLRTPTARSRKVTQRKQTFTESASSLGQCDHHGEQLRQFTVRYGSHPSGEPERLHADGLSTTRSGGLGLLRDLHDLYLLASYLDMAWMVVGRTATRGGS